MKYNVIISSLLFAAIINAAIFPLLRNDLTSPQRTFLTTKFKLSNIFIASLSKTKMLVCPAVDVAISHRPKVQPAMLKDFLFMRTFAGAVNCKNGLETWTCGSKCTQTPGTVLGKQFDISHTSGYVAYNPTLNAIIVAFQGSTSFRDVLTDFDVTQTAMTNSPDRGILIHRGFKIAYANVRSVIRAEVGKFLTKYPTAHIRSTGVSLGGALGVIAAVDLAFVFPKKASSMRVTSFGSPRVGNSKFAAHVKALFGNRVYRITNKRDVVPAMPTRNMGSGYEHAGREAWIDMDGKTRLCNGNEDSSCSAQMHNFDCLNTLAKKATLFLRLGTWIDFMDHFKYYSPSGLSPSESC